MSTKKAVAKKAVAPQADDPETPYYDGRDDEGKFAEEGSDETTDVAEEETPEVSTTVPRSRCSECSARDDLVSVGTGDAKREYCPDHVPVNAKQ